MDASKTLYLQTLCNELGDFKTAISWKDKDGNIQWSKHRSVLECWHSEEGLLFLERVNNRTSLPCEVFLDMDEEPTLEKANAICDFLESLEFDYDLFFSGSRGFHCHVLIPELILRPERASELREILIEHTKCELLKKSSGSMLALEHCPHWKTGKEKTWIRGTKWLERALNG